MENVEWIDEIDEQSFSSEVFGACTTNTFSLSDAYTNTGDWCTLSKECMKWCP